jgi:hypothetical protein
LGLVHSWFGGRAAYPFELLDLSKSIIDTEEEDKKGGRIIGLLVRPSIVILGDDLANE